MKSQMPSWTRREVLRSSAAIAAVGAVVSPSRSSSVVEKGRLNQSVCRWCYGKTSLEDLCAKGKELGLVGIDLMTPADFPTLKQYGLICTMTTSHPLSDGLCDEKYQAAALKAINSAIEATAKEGWKNVICFSGNARGIDRETGMKNCEKALREIVPVAEKAGIVLQMELLNSKVDHKDYMCDNTTWGLELVKRVGSDNFKLLYDIYHMQIMEGDVIRTIQANPKAFGHYHTGGNPGRHEIDVTQELYYPAIAKAIAETGFTGYFAHEFIPVREPLVSLGEAVELCTV
jgi:hydroxypyruvate isomerase